MKRSQAMLAARAEQRAKTWTRAHAALYADNLEQQLQDSVDATARRITRNPRALLIDWPGTFELWDEGDVTP